MIMQRIAAAISSQGLPETFIECNAIETEATTMAKNLSHQPAFLSIITAAVRKARLAAVLLLGFALVMVPPQVGFAQSTEQQERERQQREQQHREQQERDQQQRDQQQREQQERVQQHASSDSLTPNSNASLEASHPAAHPPTTDVKGTTS